MSNLTSTAEIDHAMYQTRLAHRAMDANPTLDNAEFALKVAATALLAQQTRERRLFYALPWRWKLLMLPTVLKSWLRRRRIKRKWLSAISKLQTARSKSDEKEA